MEHPTIEDVLPPYCHIRVENNLRDVINDVCVIYAESVKGDDASYLYDYRKVDIETNKNVFWRRAATVSNVPSLGVETSTEHVYFGNNRGYWQVYFTVNGESFKINKNNAMFNLSKKKDNKSVVTIQIEHYKRRHRINFEAVSGRAYFFTKKEL